VAWLGRGVQDSTPHDFTHGRVKKRLAVNQLFSCPLQLQRNYLSKIVEDDNTATAKRISLSELMKGDTSERAENNIIVTCRIIQTENNTDREERMSEQIVEEDITGRVVENIKTRFRKRIFSK
jgi:hypothetical protein